MYIVDKIIPPKKEYSLPVRYEVSVEPWEYRYTVSVMLMSLLVWIYVVFSKIGLLSQSENLKGRIGIITIIFIVLTYFFCIFTRKIEKKN